MKRRAFKTTKLKLSAITNMDDRMKLEMAFAELEAQRQIAVEKLRLAVEAQSVAQAEMMKHQGLNMKFLRQAAEYFPEVATEPQWFIFRKEGEIVLESPFTERIQRNVMRATLSQMENQVRNSDEGENDLAEGLYEEEDDGEGPKGHDA